MNNTRNYRTNAFKTDEQLGRDLDETIGHCNIIGVCIGDEDDVESKSKDKWWIRDKKRNMKTIFGSSDSQNIMTVRLFLRRFDLSVSVGISRRIYKRRKTQGTTGKHGRPTRRQCW